MRGKVGLHELAIDCIIGCHEKERSKEQKILVEIELELYFGADSLEETVDYEAVANRVKKLAIEGQFYLLETLAQTACEMVLNDFTKVMQVTMSAKKPNPFPGVAYSFATCQKAR